MIELRLYSLKDIFKLHVILYLLLHCISYFNIQRKAEYIKKSTQILFENYQQDIPKTLKELVMALTVTRYVYPIQLLCDDH